MDDQQLRALAATRPGYATYPNSRPGSPSWWRHPLPDGTTGRPPTGRDVARFTEQHLGVTVTPWQVQVLDEAFSTPPFGPLPPIPDSAYPPNAVDLPIARPWWRWLRRWRTRRHAELAEQTKEN